MGTQVSYQVRARDTDGNVVLWPQVANSFQVLAPFVPRYDILLVLDGNNQGGYDRFYKNALDELGVVYDYWDGSLRGFVDAAILAQYTGGAVIWATPDNGFLGDSEAQDNLASCLDGGGKLFMSVQYFGELGSSSFPRDYLHVSSANWCVGVRDIRGTSGDLIGDGLGFRIQGGDGANNQGCPHVITPVSPAVSVLSYVDLPGAPAQLPIKDDSGDTLPQAVYQDGRESVPFLPGAHLGPDGGEAGSEVGLLNHIRSGTAALRVDTGVYKVVYLAFGFEAIDSSTMRQEVLQRVLDWLGVKVGPRLLSPANGAGSRPGDITFRWGTVSDAIDYKFQIDRVDTFDSPDFAEIITTGTRDTATLSRGTHYWRVLARDAQLSETPWSGVRRLTIADPVLQVTTHAGGDYRPATVEAANGTLWVAWHACRSDCQVWVKTSDDGGATWLAETQLSSSNYNNYGPTITQSTGGRIWVAWYSWRPNSQGTWNNDIWYRYSDNNGATWSAEARLTTDTGEDFSPDIAAGPGNEISAVWYSYQSGNWDLWYRTGDGATWSPARQLTTDPGGDFSPAITRTSDGKMRVVWNRYGSIYYKTSPDGGVSWSPETQIAGCCNYLPSIVQTTGGRIWVAWHSRRSSNAAGVSNDDVWYKYSDDNGATWSEEVPFTRFLGQDSDPSIAGTCSGDVAVVWYSDRSGNYDIWYGVIGKLEDVSPPPLVQSVTHKPYPDPDADDVVTVTATAIDEKGTDGIAGVDLVWSVDGVSTADRPMYDDGQHGDGSSGDGTYGVRVGPFPAGTQVSYQVRATDTDGNVVLAPLTPNSFQSLAPFFVTSSILLVLDDRNQGGYDRFYKDAMADLGLPYDFWDGSQRGFVDLATLIQYTGGAVIWAMPDSGFLGDSEAQANLASALARIHRRTALGTALEEARGCSCESGIMVLEQKPARKQGAPNRCCHRTNPTVSASSLTTTAWWPMPG